MAAPPVEKSAAPRSRRTRARRSLKAPPAARRARARAPGRARCCGGTRLLDDEPPDALRLQELALVLQHPRPLLAAQLGRVHRAREDQVLPRRELPRVDLERV